MLLGGTSHGMEHTLRPEIQFSNRKIATLVSGVLSDFGDLNGAIFINFFTTYLKN
jgi:hypothetical protein